MGKAYPLTGVGPGQQMYFFDHFSEFVREKSYGSPSPYLPFLPHFLRKEISNSLKWTIAHSNPHNFFVMAWAETGAIGFLALIGITGVVLFKGLQALWVTRFSMIQYTIRFLFPSFITLFMFQQVNFFFLHPWFWTTLALAYVAAVDFEDTGAVKAS